MPKRTNGRGVAEAFARQQPATNSNDQFYTDGRTAWSYGAHWPLAHWNGGRVFVNTDKRSVTTSKHLSYVRAALAYAGHNERTVYVDGVAIRAMLREAGIPA